MSQRTQSVSPTAETTDYSVILWYLEEEKKRLMSALEILIVSIADVEELNHLREEMMNDFYGNIIHLGNYNLPAFGRNRLQNLALFFNHNVNSHRILLAHVVRFLHSITHPILISKCQEQLGMTPEQFRSKVDSRITHLTSIFSDRNQATNPEEVYTRIRNFDFGIRFQSPERPTPSTSSGSTSRGGDRRGEAIDIRGINSQQSLLAILARELSVLMEGLRMILMYNLEDQPDLVIAFEEALGHILPISYVLENPRSSLISELIPDHITNLHDIIAAIKVIADANIPQYNDIFREVMTISPQEMIRELEERIAALGQVAPELLRVHYQFIVQYIRNPPFQALIDNIIRNLARSGHHIPFSFFRSTEPTPPSSPGSPSSPNLPRSFRGRQRARTSRTSRSPSRSSSRTPGSPMMTRGEEDEFNRAIEQSRLTPKKRRRTPSPPPDSPTNLAARLATSEEKIQETLQDLQNRPNVSKTDMIQRNKQARFFMDQQEEIIKTIESTHSGDAQVCMGESKDPCQICKENTYVGTLGCGAKMCRECYLTYKKSDRFRQGGCPYCTLRFTRKERDMFTSQPPSQPTPTKKSKKGKEKKTSPDISRGFSLKTVNRARNLLSVFSRIRKRNKILKRKLIALERKSCKLIKKRSNKKML